MDNGEAMGDASNILYVNGAIQDDTPLGRLMHDFSCTKAEDMHYRVLAERVKYFKENEKGVKEMCEIMEELYNEGVERGIEAGRQEGIETGRNKMICSFLLNGGTEEAAMKMLNVTKEDIEAAKEMTF